MMNLINRGYTKGENPNEWFRGNWTIRYLGDEVEIFENADIVQSAKYYKAKINEIDLELVLDAIAESEM